MSFFSPESLLGLLPRDGVRRYCLAYSGGLDSQVLLQALHGIRAQLTGVSIEAVHVHHGLSARADDWVRHCEAQCAALSIPLRVIKVRAHPEPGMSPEDAARRARYAALAEWVGEGDCLLTAHHQDDQAETLLLQLLRGSGPRGLAGMPACAAFGEGWHARPLLDFSRDELHAFATGAGLVWVDDESNLHTGFDRNFLRHEVLPMLKQRWPAAARTLARSARHQAEVSELLIQSADADLARVRGPRTDTLSVVVLLSLSRARQRRVLRAWIDGLRLPPPHAVHVDRVLDEAAAAGVDATPCVHWDGVEVRRYRDLLYAMPPLPVHDATRVLPWTTESGLLLPEGDHLALGQAGGSGLDPQALRDRPLSIRFRQGGERCRPAGRTGHQALKKLMQARGVLPWWRDRVPLLYAGDELAAVAGLWVCAPYAGQGAQARPLCWDRASLCVAPD